MKVDIVNKIGSLIMLNLLWLLFSLPIFTIGASTSALYSITFKAVRNEEGYIFKPFVKAFKENFVKSTLAFLMILIPVFLFLLSFFVFPLTPVPFLLSALMTNTSIILFVIVVHSTVYVLPLLSRYKNTLKNTFQNSFLLGMKHFTKTVLMVILTVSPAVISLLFPQLIYFLLSLFIFILPVLIAMANSHLMLGIFSNYPALQ